MEGPVPLLPREVWHLVLSKLHHRDLARAALVCSEWAEAAADPQLWRDYSLRVRGEGLAERLERLLALPRLSQVSHVEVDGSRERELQFSVQLTDLHLGLIASTRRLRSLRLVNCDLGQWQDEGMAALVTGLVSLELEDVTWSPSQARAVCSRLVEGGKLTTLKVSCPFPKTIQPGEDDLSLCCLPPELLGSALCRLETLHLRMVTQLEDAFWQTFFQLMAVETNLKTVELEQADLTSVPPKVFSQALARLQSVDLSAVEVRQDQVVALVERVAQGSSLTHLDLSSHDLSSIPPHTLARAVTSLKKVDVSSCSLSERQVHAILLGLATGSTTKELYMTQTPGLASVPPEILAAGVNSLQRVALPRLSQHQVERLWDEVRCAALRLLLSSQVSKHTQLERLAVPDCSLEVVGQDTLARAVIRYLSQYLLHYLDTCCRIRSVDLSFCSLLPQQAEGLLHRVAAGGHLLQELVLLRVDLATVAPATLAGAAARLNSFALNR